MSDQLSSLPFRRFSIVEQTTEALRISLLNGSLTSPLPGEHTLSRHLGVSRPTLRAAFAALSREGLLIVAKGRRTRVSVTPDKSCRRTTVPSVCIICPLPRGTIFPDEHSVLLQMHARFASKAITWHEVFDRKLAGPKPESHLEKLVMAHPNTCWILLASTEQMQRWFAQSGTASLVLGSCHPRMRLPSIDINYRAVGWHAAGSMLKYGHRQIALLLPKHALAGDLAFKEGLHAYLAQSSASVDIFELQIGKSPEELRSKLDRALLLPSRPTAVFSLLQGHTLTALIHLLQSGHHIPREISLIARDLHPLLKLAMPDLAHYSRPTSQLVHRTLRLTQALLSGRSVQPLPSLITPAFIPGHTLGAANNRNESSGAA